MIYALDDHHHLAQRPAFNILPTEGNAMNGSTTTKQGAYQSQSPRLTQEGYPSWQEEVLAYDSNALNVPASVAILPVDSVLTSLPILSPNPAILFTPTISMDSALHKELWTQLVEEPTSYSFSPHLDLETGIGFEFDGRLAGETEATPPLAFDLDIPTIPAESSNPEPQHVSTSTNANTSATVHPSTGVDERSRAAPSIELIAPRPMRLVNPAIHLAALVEEDEDSAALGTSSWEEAQDSQLTRATEHQEEYMSDSSDSMDEDVEELAPSSSIPPFALSAAKLDEWSFPPVVQIAPPESNSFDFSQASPYGVPYASTYGIAPQWQQPSPQVHPRTHQLQESLRSRRATRIAGNSHGRHASLPDVQYRPVKWNLPPPSEDGLQTRNAGRHRETRSIDWPSFGLQNVPLPPQATVYPQHPAMSYRRQSIGHPYGMQ